MKTTLYAIVPGDTQEDALENTHKAFLELCHTESQSPGGTIPIFDWYQLYEDSPRSDVGSGISRTSSQETVDMMDDVWESMLERLRDLEDQDEPKSDPGTAARSREYRIYDKDARPVLTPTHYNNLIGANDNWVVAARFSW